MISMKMEFYLPKHVVNDGVNKLKIIVFSGVQRRRLMLFRSVHCDVCERTVSYESRSHKLKCEQTLSLLFYLFISVLA
jgi:hypothetical protein